MDRNAVLCLTIASGPRFPRLWSRPEEVDVLLWLFPPGVDVRADDNPHSVLTVPSTHLTVALHPHPG